MQIENCKVAVRIKTLKKYSSHFEKKFICNWLTADGPEDALEQGRGRGRAAGYARAHGDDLVDAPEGGVAFAENAAVAPAVPHRNDQLRQRRGVIGPPERDLHVPRDRPGDEQHVREPRRGGEVNAEALAVVDGIVDRVDLKLAPVARARVDLPDGEASPKPPFDGLLQLGADLLELRVAHGRQRLGDDAGAEYLFKDSDHKTPK